MRCRPIPATISPTPQPITAPSLSGIQKQIYLDCNVSEAIKVKDDLYIAPSVVLPGSRVINKMDPFFRVVVFILNSVSPNSAQFLSSVSTCLRPTGSAMGLSWSCVGMLWSGIQNICPGLKHRSPRARMPANACGEVTS